MEDYLPVLGCASCGKCCKSLPGQFYPSDLGESIDERRRNAAKLLSTGKYSVDWWEGDLDDNDYNRVLHIRPATLAGVNRLMDPTWGGQCVFLGGDGCELPRESRPFVCKNLKPTPELPGCSNGPKKEDVARAWISDTIWLEELVKELRA